MAQEKPSDKTEDTGGEQYPTFIRAAGIFFREHPTIAATLLYLQVTTVGVVYSWALFRRFEINVFDYAEPSDFLLAAFKDPIVFGMSVATLLWTIYIAVTWPSQNRMPSWLESRLIWLESRLKVRSESSQFLTKVTTELNSLWRTIRRVNRLMMYTSPLLVVAYSTIIPFMFANSAADSLLSDSSGESLTSVRYKATSKSGEQTTETGLRVIGATQSFVFFYDRKEPKTLIIPSAQIVEIEHRGPKYKPQEKGKK